MMSLEQIESTITGRLNWMLKQFGLSLVLHPEAVNTNIYKREAELAYRIDEESVIVLEVPLALLDDEAQLDVALGDAINRNLMALFKAQKGMADHEG